MGAIGSSLRRDMPVEELEMGNQQQHIPYRYPPKTGDCYFGSFFWMGGERFDMSQPEAYLFGDNADVNFLTGRAGPFNYPAPKVREPTRTLQSLVNIRKDSLHLVRSQSNPDEYSVEFTFDSDAPVAVTILYRATENIHDGGVRYSSRHGLSSAVFHYPAGFGQTFSHPEHVVRPTDWPQDQLSFPSDSPPTAYPVVVYMEVEQIDTGDTKGHAHVTIATFEKSSDNTFSIKVAKQKQLVDGVLFLLQDIYGVASKEDENPESDDDDSDDDSSGLECELCLTEIRDTLILPCRHLCLCSTCAETLRFSASTCPFCRQPFHALLHLGAVQRLPPSSQQTRRSPALEEEGSSEPADVHLLEVINNTRSTTPSGGSNGAKISTEEGETVIVTASPEPTELEVASCSQEPINGVSSVAQQSVLSRPDTQCSVMSDFSHGRSSQSPPSLPGQILLDNALPSPTHSTPSSKPTDLEEDSTGDGSSVALLGKDAVEILPANTEVHI